MTKAGCHAHAECIEGKPRGYVRYAEMIITFDRSYTVNAIFLELTLIRGHGKGDEGGVSRIRGVYKRERGYVRYAEIISRCFTRS